MNYTLDFDDTQALIDALYINEVNTIERFRYNKPQAQINDLQNCAKAYEEANNLLQMEKQQSGESQDKQDTLVQDIWKAARAGVVFSYETIKNFKLRAEYLNKISNSIKLFDYHPETGRFRNTHFADILDPEEDLYDMINKSIQEWAKKTSDVWGNAAAYKEKTFNNFIEGKEYNLESYVVRYAGKDKLKLLSYMRYFGTALIVFTLGVITWQLVEKQDKIRAGAEILVSVGGALGGGLLGEVGGTFLFGWIMEDLGAVIGGILGGLVGAFAGGVAAVCLFDAMLDAFFYTPKVGRLTGTLFSGPIMYELTLPDNTTLSGNLTGSL
ncbi:hypothetical protein J2Z32_001168 [Paenibacillus turicensis]|uniref:LXG domain-containing protein n=1 Tax=Paenibacillus turicensis TaxID=160487 RepID=A0ABS4FPP5_9BACL|nr:hypothetical protein [Paenibacillus turicensis]MBP1904545.1 hypothetical protein [Paenibacillus turicensis]